MINFIRHALRTAKQFTLLDRSIVKVTLIIVGLLLAKLFPILTSLHRAYYLAAIFVTELYFIYKISQTK